MFQAVSEVHEQNIVHRDLKPANFVRVNTELKLIDFGMAQAISSDGEPVKGVAVSLEGHRQVCFYGATDCVLFCCSAASNKISSAVSTR